MVCPFNTRCEQSMAVGRLALILAFALGSIRALDDNFFPLPNTNTNIFWKMATDTITNINLAAFADTDTGTNNNKFQVFWRHAAAFLYM